MKFEIEIPDYVIETLKQHNIMESEISNFMEENLFQGLLDGYGEIDSMVEVIYKWCVDSGVYKRMQLAVLKKSFNAKIF